MVNKYYVERRKELRKEARNRYQNLSEEEKEKGIKRPKPDTKIFPMKLRKTNLSIMKK